MFIHDYATAMFILLLSHYFFVASALAGAVQAYDASNLPPELCSNV